MWEEFMHFLILHWCTDLEPIAEQLWSAEWRHWCCQTWMYIRKPEDLSGMEKACSYFHFPEVHRQGTNLLLSYFFILLAKSSPALKVPASESCQYLFQGNKLQATSSCSNSSSVLVVVCYISLSLLFCNTVQLFILIWIKIIMLSLLFSHFIIFFTDTIRVMEDKQKMLPHRFSLEWRMVFCNLGWEWPVFPAIPHWSLWAPHSY